MIQQFDPTSVVTAEVKTKQTAEQKILTGVKTTWEELKNSDRNWKQNGRKFGKWCSDLRKLTKKQGSRMGKGFEATVKRLGVDFQKARYWADFVDGKHKAEYAGAKSKPKTNDDVKDGGHKLTPFMLVGVSEAEQAEITDMVKGSAVTFSRFIYRAAVAPDEAEVRWLVDRCCAKLPSGQDRLQLLTELRTWIDEQIPTGDTNLESELTTEPELEVVM